MRKEPRSGSLSNRLVMFYAIVLPMVTVGLWVRLFLGIGQHLQGCSKLHRFSFATIASICCNYVPSFLLSFFQVIKAYQTNMECGGR